MCLVSYRPELSRCEGALSFETFRSLVDGNPRLRRVTLQGLGEPLLAPDLDRMVEHAAARGIAMGFNTNAMLLTERRAERLLRAGPAPRRVSRGRATRPPHAAIPRRPPVERGAGDARAAAAGRRRPAPAPPASVL